MNIDRFIDDFNNGDYENIEKYFSSVERFINILIKMKKIDELDVDRDYSNLILLAQYEQGNRQQVLNHAVNCFVDVTKVGEDYYMTCNREDLADFFESGGRDYDLSKIAKKVLHEDFHDFYDWYGGTEVYSEIYDNLTKENQLRVNNRIKSELLGTSIDINSQTSSLMDELSNGSDQLILTEEILNELFEDQDSIDYILNELVDDIKNDLLSIHNGAQNDSYHNEIYDDVVSELEQYFDMKTGEWEKGVGSKKDKYFFKVKINVFSTTIVDYLEENKGLYDNDICYEGSYFGILKSLMINGRYEELSFRVPEYPDYRRVEEYMNNMIPEYF